LFFADFNFHRQEIIIVIFHSGKVSDKFKKQRRIILNIYLAAMEERLGFINLDGIKAIMDKVQCK